MSLEQCSSIVYGYQMSAPIDRRESILAAALRCFVEKGYRGTSIADIRTASGASTGSIYHFFSGKGAIAEALLRQSVSGWADQSGTASDDPETAIKASVTALVIWGLANPGHLRFLDEVRILALTDPELVAVRNLIDQGHEAAAARFGTMQQQGAVRKIPFAIAHALMLGPAYSYLRQAPSASPDEARRLAGLFADAAWQAVRS